MGVRLWRRGLDLILRLDCAPATLKGGKYRMLKRGNGQEPILLMWAPGYHQTEGVRLRLPKTKLRTCKLCLVPGSDSWLAEKQLHGSLD